MQKMAKAYYKASPERVQQSANQFFDEMDSHKNKRVKLKEYVPFMKGRGHIQMCNDNFFNLLDVGRKGYLEFWDVMTVYYIVKSRRPFCDGCANFIMGAFFTCVKCFKDIKFPATSPTFNLCSHCFRHQNYCHDHKEFLDNLLLEIIRAGSNFDNKNNPEPSTSNPGISSSRPPETKPDYSKAIVVATNPQRNKAMLDRALQLTKIAAVVGSFLVKLADALAVCSASSVDALILRIRYLSYAIFLPFPFLQVLEIVLQYHCNDS